MPRYRSRMKGGAVSAPRKTKAQIVRELKQKNVASIGGAGGSVLGIDTGGELVPASVEEGGAFSSGGSLRVGGSLRAGGSIGSDIKEGLLTAKDISSVAKEGLTSAAKGVRDIAKQNLSGLVKKGATGVADIAKRFASARNLVQNMNHSSMINLLHHMPLPDFSLLQGIASSSLGNVLHPMKNIIRQHLGGKFEHPRGISKVATKDILMGSQLDLAKALHHEFVDMQNGRKVGGGLLDSVKHHFIRGLSGFNSKLKSGLEIAKKFERILHRANQFAEQVAPSLKSALPQFEPLIETGLSGLKALDVGLEKGIALAEGAGGIGRIVEEELGEDE